jgi:uncharacterized membrane protein YjfL (UPF0719 family)
MMDKLAGWGGLFAQTTGGTLWNWERLAWNLFLVVVYGFVGLGFLALAYFAIDRMTPFSFRKEIIDEKNTALAILLGAVFLAVAFILAAAIH